MNQWPDILFNICAVCAPLVCYRLGKLSTRREAENALAALVEVSMKAGRQMREIRDRDALIEQMKRAGRKRREEVKAIKKALKTMGENLTESGDGLLLLVALALAEINAEMLRKNTAMRDALHEIAAECGKSRWQMKVFRRILKKHGVKSYV